mmetsp:Transcript_90499/g.158170  ORF Transcript_90499/g.158170 Transcript_90499/m.158170 type:complete len:594 (-) Transcript_90499:129-1910(-)
MYSRMSGSRTDGLLEQEEAALTETTNRLSDGNGHEGPADRSIRHISDLEASEPMLESNTLPRPKWWVVLGRQALAGLLSCLALVAVSLAVVALALMAETEQLTGIDEEKRRGTSLGSDPPEGSGYFLQITDFHLDPEYNASYGPRCFCNRPADQSLREACLAESTASSGNGFGQDGCDSPMELVHAVLEAAAAKAPSGGYDFVLVTGDFVRHKMWHYAPHRATHGFYVREIIRNVTEAVERHFPGTPFHHHHSIQMRGFRSQATINVGHERSKDLYTLGNADFNGDYNVEGLAEDGPNEWFTYMEPVLNKSLGPQDGVLRAHHTFRRGGYYMRRLTRSLYLIFLDTVIYSFKDEAKTANLEDPFGQLEWLEQMLAWIHRQPLSFRMKPKKAIIAGHIPPTIDQYSFEHMWSARFVDRYLKIVTRYAFVVAAQVFAHLHASTFRLLPSMQHELPLFVTSAVSPVYGNNPSFRVWRYEGCYLMDYTDYSAELRHDGPQSHLDFQAHSSARQLYGLRSLAAEEWRTKVAEQIRQNDTVWRRYLRELWACTSCTKLQTSLDSRTFRMKSACAIENVHDDDFRTCVGAWPVASSPEVA